MAGAGGRAPGVAQGRADTPALQQRPARAPGAAAGAAGASGACAAARAAARAPGSLRWPIDVSRCNRVRAWSGCRAAAPLQAGHAGGCWCMHAWPLCAHLVSPCTQAALLSQPACIQRHSTAKCGACARAPASQSSMAMTTRRPTSPCSGAAGGRLGAPAAGAPSALRLPAPLRAGLHSLPQRPTAGSGPGIPASGRARAEACHQLTSSRQLCAHSTVPSSVWTADPVGLPQCRIPHAAVPPGIGSS